MKPKRQDINDLSLHSPIVRACLNSWDHQHVTYEEALIMMVKIYEAETKTLRATIKELSVYAPPKPIIVKGT